MTSKSRDHKGLCAQQADDGLVRMQSQFEETRPEPMGDPLPSLPCWPGAGEQEMLRALLAGPSIILRVYWDCGTLVE
jgi:hypothetical protein